MKQWLLNQLMPASVSHHCMRLCEPPDCQNSNSKLLCQLGGKVGGGRIFVDHWSEVGVSMLTLAEWLLQVSWAEDGWQKRKRK